MRARLDSDAGGRGRASARPALATLRFLTFELCSSCNLRCIYCPLDHRRKMALDLALLEKGLYELSGRLDLRLEILALHCGGEPLMHPRIDEALQIMARHRAGLRRVRRVSLTTNGTLVRGELARLLAECRGIDTVVFSIDGGSPAEFERWRKGARWEQVAANLRNFSALVRDGKHPRKAITVHCLVPRDRPLDTSWMDPEFRELLAGVDGVTLRWPHFYDGTQVVEGIRADPHRKSPGEPCIFLETTMVVLASGRVTICPHDLNHRGDLGHLRRSALGDIWQGRKRAQARSRWRRGLFEKIEPCRTCEGFDVMHGVAGIRGRALQGRDGVAANPRRDGAAEP
jgi:radical SAM protein with 4Fe4S-binding SPASM domain